MPSFLQQANNVTIDNVTQVSNASDLPSLFVQVNNFAFDGYMTFIALMVIFFVTYMTAQRVQDQPLNNAMYSGAFVTVLAFLLRAVNVTINGISYGLLTDKQLWVFPIITILLAVVIYATKE